MEAKQDEAAVAKFYDEMYQHMINKDMNALSNMMTDNFYLIHLTGKKELKNEFLQSIENGSLNYYSYSDTDLSVTVNGEKATLTGKSIVSAAVYGGEKKPWKLQLDIDLEKINGQWLMTTMHGSIFE
ncbi:nuclear transport factor 2 family protein [Histomonas meleagridis]|uniref:nuclear transport factor 2 family protein n=1 Tax=Histomonas meleagridis TaxID=135588 RepID=UPI00355A3A1E|nr:nuclear transport factor 2 family protein [Histomonas meleagridis]KAH0797591.1 nuclear transport factor 2 family protein [Histomonas meleagridis]